MRQLANGRVSNDILRKLFFKQLPSFLTGIFVTTGVSDLNRAAAAADKTEEKGLTFSGQVISTAKIDPGLSIATNQSINELIIALSDSVQQLLRNSQNYSGRFRNNYFQRTGSRSRSNGRNRSQSQSNKRRFSKCCFHFQFGHNTHYCRR